MTPYLTQPPKAFWKLCREDHSFRLAELYSPKFKIEKATKVAVAGSCFAQHLGRYLRAAGGAFFDAEPAPIAMSQDLAKRYGYGILSARYGNIYTARQLLQLVRDASEGHVYDATVWEKDGRYYDALRPTIEPGGLETSDLVHVMRLDHLKHVKRMFQEADVFIFTLGLTEAWLHRETGIAFPIAPGIVAGEFSQATYEFRNFGLVDVLEDMTEAIRLIRTLNPEIKFLLTVSPVSLTATATDNHVLMANTYSKSTLRAVVGELAMRDKAIDYLPSYEVITGTPFRAGFYAPNLREVTPDGVNIVMSMFLRAHGLTDVPVVDPVLNSTDHALINEERPNAESLMCDEELLEAFAEK